MYPAQQEFVVMEQIIRKRGIRIVLGLALLAVGFWAFLPYVSYRVALSAFVNAEITRITTPIRGQVADVVPRKGEFLTTPVTLNLVEAVVSDHGGLVRLENQLSGFTEQALLHEEQLQAIKEAAQKLDKRISQYKKAVIERSVVEIERFEAVVVACRAEQRARRNALRRMRTLERKGAATRNDLDIARSAHESNTARCQGAEARVKQSRAEQAAARQGIFLQNGSNDAPYSQQQRDRLFLRRQEGEVALLHARARAAQITDEIVEERKRLEGATRFETTIPAEHVIWTLLTSPGSAVVEGQPVLDIADCRKRFVVVELSERDFEFVKAGDKALIRLIGADEWVAGPVIQVRGSAASYD
ncbi:MAG: HlyD family efflux transporter periplasmic adaptor subunit, partial [Alphaproteobacteria bacterium]